jgi:hypothetical protein
LIEKQIFFQVVAISRLLFVLHGYFVLGRFGHRIIVTVSTFSRGIRLLATQIPLGSKSFTTCIHDHLIKAILEEYDARC